MKLVLIGPMPPPVGGATVLFEQLVGCLGRIEGVQVFVIDTATASSSGVFRVFRAAKCLAQVVFLSMNADVISFHASKRGILIVGPILKFMSMVLRRPLVLRAFGGGLGDWYRAVGGIGRRVFRCGVLSADVFFLERKTLVDEFSSIATGRVEWLPNSRPLSARGISNDSIRDSTRFVFLAHVKPSKGIRELLRASQLLSAREFSIDVYGPLEDGVTLREFDGMPVRYMGTIPSGAVSETLSRYDVLVLPTYYEGEGHPGVILEAFNAGLAIIATEWAGIPELISPNEGLLIPTKNVNALVDAMDLLIRDRDRLARMQAASTKKAEAFDSWRWAAHFVDICANARGERK